LLGLRNPARRGQDVQRRKQQRERLFVAPLARAQARTAAESRASTSRWKPPMPFAATIRPARKAAAAASSAASRVASGSPSARIHASCGPQIGQAFGCAWKRRLRGSPYSAAQAGHIWKARIVVCARSYGRASTML
jgi:hypothetical protein